MLRVGRAGQRAVAGPRPRRASQNGTTTAERSALPRTAARAEARSRPRGGSSKRVYCRSSDRIVGARVLASAPRRGWARRRGRCRISPRLSGSSRRRTVPSAEPRHRRPRAVDLERRAGADHEVGLSERTVTRNARSQRGPRSSSGSSPYGLEQLGGAGAPPAQAVEAVQRLGLPVVRARATDVQQRLAARAASRAGRTVVPVEDDAACRPNQFQSGSPPRPRRGPGWRPRAATAGPRPTTTAAAERGRAAEARQPQPGGHQQEQHQPAQQRLAGVVLGDRDTRRGTSSGTSPRPRRARAPRRAGQKARAAAAPAQRRAQQDRQPHPVVRADVGPADRADAGQAAVELGPSSSQCAGHQQPRRQARPPRAGGRAGERARPAARACIAGAGSQHGRPGERPAPRPCPRHGHRSPPAGAADRKSAQCAAANAARARRASASAGRAGPSRFGRRAVRRGPSGARPAGAAAPGCSRGPPRSAPGAAEEVRRCTRPPRTPPAALAPRTGVTRQPAAASGAGEATRRRRACP